MELTLAEAAAIAGGRLEGDPELRLTGIRPLGGPPDGEGARLSFWNGKDPAALAVSGAAAVLVPAAKRPDGGPPAGRHWILCEDPLLAFARIAARFHPLPRAERTEIHPSAVVSPEAELEDPLMIGPLASIAAGVKIGAGTIVMDGCVLGEGVVVGRNCLLHPRVVLYPGVRLGDRVRVHAGAVLGSDGFGNAPSRQGWVRIPQVGTLVVEDDVEIGANTCVDRGALEETRIGRGCRLDNLVHVAHNCRLGPHCALAAQVGLAGSTEVGSWCRFGGQAGVAGHVTIGDRAVVGAQAGIHRDVPAGAFVLGTPARDARLFWKEFALLSRLLAGRARPGGRGGA